MMVKHTHHKHRVESRLWVVSKICMFSVGFALLYPFRFTCPLGCTADFKCHLLEIICLRYYRRAVTILNSRFSRRGMGGGGGCYASFGRRATVGGQAFCSR